MRIGNVDTHNTIDIIRRNIDIVVVKNHIPHIIEIDRVVLPYNLRVCDVKDCITLHEDTVVISVERRVSAMQTILPCSG